MNKTNHVVVLDEAVDDLNKEKLFYTTQALWLGGYFWDSMLSDIESLYIYAGVHQKYYGYYRMLSKRFPYAIYYDLQEKIAK